APRELGLAAVRAREAGLARDAEHALLGLAIADARRRRVHPQDGALGGDAEGHPDVAGQEFHVPQALREAAREARHARVERVLDLLARDRAHQAGDLHAVLALAPRLAPARVAALAGDL